MVSSGMCPYSREAWEISGGRGEDHVKMDAETGVMKPQ